MNNTVAGVFFEKSKIEDSFDNFICYSRRWKNFHKYNDQNILFPIAPHELRAEIKQKINDLLKDQDLLREMETFPMNRDD